MSQTYVSLIKLFITCSIKMNHMFIHTTIHERESCIGKVYSRRDTVYNQRAIIITGYKSNGDILCSELTMLRIHDNHDTDEMFVTSELINGTLVKLALVKDILPNSGRICALENNCLMWQECNIGDRFIVNKQGFTPGCRTPWTM